jgi:predicted dehydrogenase/threonine dehydrogenase-like Zn-dependent dehydrogenase
MRQLFQNLKTGETTQEVVPVPQVPPGHVLVQSSRSLISLGTERMLVEFGKAGWIEKAVLQPEKVRQVVQKVRTDGLQPTVRAVSSKLEQPIPLGYSNVGIVREVGSGVKGISVGDRVVSNGPHSEVICVPENLCAVVPNAIDDDTASFCVVSSIALQGIRLIEPTIGESVAVVGLGLLGLLSCQILRSNGCRVVGFDFDRAKTDLATSYGVETLCLEDGVDPVRAAVSFSQGHGVDAVVITAATKSSQPVNQAAQMCRKRGRIILVGVAGLKLDRADFYEKEISFQVSCSYGPGRYEQVYEKKGLDYPIGFVRWTAKRNFQAILGLMAEGKIRTDGLVTEEVLFDDVKRIYESKINNSAALGFIIRYPEIVDYSRTCRRSISSVKSSKQEDSVKVGLIGAGSYGGAVLLPAFHKTSAQIIGLATQSGFRGTALAGRFGIGVNTTDYRVLLEDEDINTVVIATRHDLHAELVIGALEAGKHVFVEKPLALNEGELDRIKQAYETHQDQHLVVGFNRRFSPLSVRAQRLLNGRQSPLTMTMLVNAGEISDSHWTQDPEIGGGRIVGEACHFVDLLSFLAGSSVNSVFAAKVDSRFDPVSEDKAIIQLSFSDGSIGVVQYFSNGSKGFPKERLEVFSDGRVLQIDNFKTLRGFGFSGFRKLTLRSQDKGHRDEVANFVKSIEQGQEPIVPFVEAENSMRATFAALRAITEQRPVEI